MPDFLQTIEQIGEGRISCIQNLRRLFTEILYLSNINYNDLDKLRLDMIVSNMLKSVGISVWDLNERFIKLYDAYASHIKYRAILSKIVRYIFLKIEAEQKKLDGSCYEDQILGYFAIFDWLILLIDNKYNSKCIKEFELTIQEDKTHNLEKFSEAFSSLCSAVLSSARKRSQFLFKAFIACLLLITPALACSLLLILSSNYLYLLIVAVLTALFINGVIGYFLRKTEINVKAYEECEQFVNFLYHGMGQSQKIEFFHKTNKQKEFRVFDYENDSEVSFENTNHSTHI